MKKIIVIMEKTASDLVDAVDGLDVDVGRFIATLDTLHQAGNTAIAALILPHCGSTKKSDDA